ncbi:PspC domain-containing protein [Nocardia sp. CNY236]|uniref:PspC domain-containing protein n=1 Tax=Nocardia sp. CNY236 TaxID=1169152 RepID=UPI000562715B|nr:PspC domain-containing protein [Nocardia sp. CNY236]
MTRTGFGDQLQHLWLTRPVRLPRHGPLAGIATGFAQRYTIDPLLVRVAFVVSTIFGGAGVVLYLAAWLLLRAEGDRASAVESLLGKGPASQSQTKTIVLIVALAIAVSTMGPLGVGLGGSGPISAALMLAGWWMLHMRTPIPPSSPIPASSAEAHGDVTPNNAATGYPGTVFPHRAPRSAPDMSAPAATAAAHPGYTRPPHSTVPEAPVRPTDDESAHTTDHTAPVPVTRGIDDTYPGIPEGRTMPLAHGSALRDDRSPPSWDPLGVAPLAWDLPEPTPATPAASPPKRSSYTPLTSVVVGLAILAAAGATTAAALGVEWMTPGRIGATALAVVGLGMMIGAFRRRGYGLLVITAPLAAFVLLASMIGPGEFHRGAMGEHTWSPAALDELAQNYTVTLGSGTLDLRPLTLTESRAVDVTVRVGEARVLLPADMTVRTRCTVSLGEAACSEGTSGPNTPGSPVLDLRVDVRMGSVEVRRA